MELTQLTFAVDTTPLDTADKKIRGLGEALKTLERPMSAIAKDSSTVASGVEEVASKAQAAGSKLKGVEASLEKVSTAMKIFRGETVDVGDEVVNLGSSFTKSQANFLALQKQFGASADQLKSFAKEFNDFNRITSANTFDNSIAGVQRLTKDIRELSEVNKLAAANTTLTRDQVMNLVRDTERLQQAMQSMGKSNDEINASIAQQTQQYVNLANEKNKLIAQTKAMEDAAKAEARAQADALEQAKNLSNYRMQNWASSVGTPSTELSSMKDHYQKAEREAADFYATMEAASNSYRSSFIANQEAEIKQMEKRKKMWQDLYGADNAAAIKEEEDAVKQLAAANAYTTSKMEQLRAQVAGLEKGLTTASSNALYQFEKNLKATGVAADVAEKQVAEFTTLLQKKQNSSPFASLVKDAEETRKQVNHLARDVSVQLGDVAISLAGGQNPFMVMIQQGDQIRGALMRAKDSGVDSSNAIRNALGMMASSFVDVGKMAGTFFVGSIESAGNAVKRLVAEKTFLGAAIDSVKTKLAAQGEASFSTIGAINKLGSAFTMLAGAGIVGATLALGTFVVAQLSAIKESDNLVRVLETQGAAFGMSKDQVIALSEGFSSISSSSAIQFMSQLAAAGGEADSNLKMLTEAAVNLEKYGGVSIEKTAKAYADLSEKPLEGLIKIAKETGQVSQATLDQAAALALAKDKTELVELAQRAYAEAIKSTGDAVEQNLSPLARTWIGIKDAMSLMFDEFKRSDSAATALTAISYVASGVHKVITGIVLAIQTLGIAAGATVDLATNQVSNIFDAEKRKSEHKRIMQAMQDSVGDAANSMMNSWMKFDDALFKTTSTTKTLSAEQRKANSQAADEFEKNTKVAQEWGKEVDKAKAKSMSLADLEAKNLAKLKNATQDQIKLAKEAAKVEFESNQKKGSTKKPSETYKVDFTNEVEEAKKLADRKLKISKEYESAQRDILKNEYEARRISLGEYLGEDVKLTLQSRDEQLRILEEGNTEYNRLMQDRTKAVQAAAEAAISAGGNKTAIEEKEAKQLADLKRQIDGTNEAYRDQVDAATAATQKKFSEHYKELAKSVNESDKALKEFNSTVEQNAAAREQELALQIQLSDAYGAEAEAIKARSAAMKTYSSEINKQNKLVKDQEKVVSDLLDKMVEAEGETLEKLDVMALEAIANLTRIRKNAAETEAQARIDAEKAATNAIQMYNLQKYNEMRDTLSDSIYTALFEGGKQGGDILKSYLMKEFKNFAIKVFIEPIIGSLLGGFGGSIAGDIGSSASGGGTLGTLSNVISAGSTVMKLLTNPMVLGNQMAQGVVAVGDALFKAGFEQMGNAVTGWASTAEASSIMGGLGSAAAGYAASTLISNGYKTGLGDAVDIAGAIGSYFLGPFAGAVSGLINRSFGRKLKDTGIQGAFGSEGFSGEAYRFEQGGWLRSNKTTLSELDPNITNSLTAQYNQLKLGTAMMAVSLGAGVESIKNFTTSIKVSFKGLNEEEIGKKLEETFGKISDAMSAGVLRELAKVADPAKYEEVFGSFSTTIKGVTYTSLDQINADLATWRKELESGVSVFGTTLSDSSKTWIYEAIQEAEKFMSDNTSTLVKDYQQYGESFTETLSRLTGSLLAVNGMFELLGQTAFESSLKGADAAYKYAEAFGGIEQFNTKFGNFYDKFYSDAEKFESLTNLTTSAFEKAGIEMPKTREEFLNMVDANIKLGQSGAETTNFLLTQADAIDTLYPKVGAFTASTLKVFEDLGLAAESLSNEISNTLTSIITSKSTSTKAGNDLANSLVNQIVSSVTQKKTKTISDKFVDSFVTPILQNIEGNKDVFEGIDVEGSTAAFKKELTDVKTESDKLTKALSDSLKPSIIEVTSVAAAAKTAFDAINDNVYSEVSNKLAESLFMIKTGAEGADEASKNLAATIGNTLKSALIKAMTQDIADIYTEGIVKPVSENIKNGVEDVFTGVDVSSTMQKASTVAEGYNLALTKLDGTLTSATSGVNELVNSLGGVVSISTTTSGGSYTPGPFAIGGSAIGRYVPPTATNLLGSLEDIGKDIQAAIDRTAELLDGVGIKKVEGLEQLQATVAQMFADLGGPELETAAATAAQRAETYKDLVPAANALVEYMTGIQDPGMQGYSIAAANDMAEKIRGMIEALPGIGEDIKQAFQSSESIYGSDWNALSTLVNLPEEMQYLASLITGAVGSFAIDSAQIGPAQHELDTLNTALREWMKAQTRLMATEDLAKLSDETFAAKDRIEELKRTGGLEDPITKLKEAFAQKIKTIDDGIGKALLEEIDILKNKKADVSGKQAQLDVFKQTIANFVSPENVAAIQYAIGYAEKELAGIYELLRAGNDPGVSQNDVDRVTQRMEENKKLLAQIQSGEYVASFADDIAAMEKEITDLLIAATEPAKQQELLDEIAKYKGGITEWFKAQQELLSTEMLVDINQQIKELETAEQGPITAIKSAIDKYIADFKALDQYTPEVKAQLDKLAGLQLGKARADLYNQLLPDEVVKQNALADLTKQFTDLGQKLPATTTDFKTLIDSITDQNLKDKLLELIPAFIGLQDAVESVATSSIEDLTKQFTEAYKSELGRMPDTAGLKYWIDLVQSGTMTMEKAMEAFSEAATGEKLNMRILELTDAEAYLAQVRANELSLLSPTNQELQKRIYALEDELAILEQRKALEQQLLQLLGNTAALRAQELAALDASNRALQQQIYAIEDARAATDKAVAALERATAEQIKQLEKTFTATDLAMQVLEKAVDKEKQRLQDQLKSAQDSSNALKKVFDTLEKAIKSLRAQVEPTAKLAVQEARAVLSSALTSGIASDTTALEDAISVLKADVEQGLYATSYDKSRAFLTLANDLEKLKQNSEPQLTTAEQQVKLAEEQIKQLDDLLEKARDQVSAIRDVDASLFGIDESITAVELAQKQLLSATQAEQEARAQIDKLNEQLLEFKTQVEVLRSIDNSVIDVETAVLGVKEAISIEMKAIADAVAMSVVSSSGGGAGGGGTTPIPPTATTPSQPVRPVTPSPTTPTVPIVPTVPSQFELSIREFQIEKLYEQNLGRPADDEGLNFYLNSDKSLQEIAKDLEFAKSVGAYADGGRYPGGLALVGEEGPELINFSNPGMVYTAAQSANLMQADNSDLAEELRALRQEVQMLRAEARATAVNTSKTARILDDVTQGGDSLKTTTA